MSLILHRMYDNKTTTLSKSLFCNAHPVTDTKSFHLVKKTTYFLAKSKLKPHDMCVHYLVNKAIVSNNHTDAHHSYLCHGKLALEGARRPLSLSLSRM